jgi:hypothetical protein
MVMRGRPSRIFSDQSRYLDRFGLLLTVTVGSIVLLALVSIYEPEASATGKLVSIAASCFVGATLYLALRAAGIQGRWLNVVGGLVLFTMAGIAVATLTGVSATMVPGNRSSIPAPIIITLLAAVAPVVVVRRLLQHRIVTRGTLMGAVSAYLLIPVAFFYAFLSVNNYGSTPFFGTEEASQTYMYFSLTTVATVGYGDFTAKTDLGRLLANTEALIGQIYLVSVVAMLVGLFSQQWLAQRRDAKQDDATGDQTAES